MTLLLWRLLSRYCNFTIFFSLTPRPQMSLQKQQLEGNWSSSVIKFVICKHRPDRSSQAPPSLSVLFHERVFLHQHFSDSSRFLRRPRKTPTLPVQSATSSGDPDRSIISIDRKRFEFLALTHAQLSGAEETFVSMLSPAEWGPRAPEHVGSYKLEHDMSYTRLEDLGRKAPLDPQLLGLPAAAACRNLLPLGPS
jgi:hypothetical protein